jgi:DNA mismatch repair protein MutS2
MVPSSRTAAPTACAAPFPRSPYSIQVAFLPEIPSPLTEISAAALQWPELIERVSRRAQSPLGRMWTEALEPSSDVLWVEQQQQRNAEMQRFVTGGTFDFRGIYDVTETLDKARIEGSALEAMEIRSLIVHAERVEAWRQTVLTPPDPVRGQWPGIEELTAPLLARDLGDLLRSLSGKIEPDGSLSDDASPELRRIRRAMEHQHRAIETSLRRALTKLSEDGSTQESLITVRGERFVIPVKNEFKRKVGGVIHGSSSSGLGCVRPRFAGGDSEATEEDSDEFDLVAARHPLLELRLRAQGGEIVPLTVTLPAGKRQMIISGPNTGGKTVALKTSGLIALMAQAGLPVPAEKARLPFFTAIYADIGDAQSIEQNLSTFSAHIVHVEHIARHADSESLVLLDELGSATDPEEGAALAVAVAEHFLERKSWCVITTHLTSLKVYAAKHEGVVNAAVGFDEVALAPTYELRLGVPGASAGLNIAARLGLDPAIVANARAQMTTQQVDIGRFLDELHAQLTAAATERDHLKVAERELARERLRLEQKGRAEQQARTRELEKQLKSLIEDFESQLRDTVKAIDDKTVAQKIARDSALRIARLKREFSEQFQATVVAHSTPWTNTVEKATADRQREPKVGDLVRLKSLNREGRVVRVIDAKTLEIAVGSMKTRVGREDIAEITAVSEKPLEAVKRRGGITVSTTSNSDDSDYMTSEINVIGRTADEAESEVERFVERAFLAGLPRIRVVHGVGMGILRRTLRDFLVKHPHVTSVSEPPYNEGGQGATIVELRV